MAEIKVEKFVNKNYLKCHYLIIIILTSRGDRYIAPKRIDIFIIQCRTLSLHNMP